MKNNFNLGEWRSAAGLREQLRAFEDNLQHVINENERLKEELSARSDELANEIREELKEQYEEMNSQLEHKIRKLQRRIEELEDENRSLYENIEQMQHDQHTKEELLRSVLGITTNITNYGTFNNVEDKAQINYNQ
jgi:predicted nuclease with TOPRIM domain